MASTLNDRPGFFWYFNNGVTIVCDGAEKIERGGKSLLRLANPQIINGQQTTRMLNLEDQKAGKASVLVRVIRIPREPGEKSDRFEELVSRIVEATNWQNQIRASDLMSNDRQQILLEREFRKLGYQYLRKRQTKGEARRSAASQYRFLVKKDEIAQAVGACELDPVVVREGKEGLFEERYYATIFGSSDAEFYLARYWLMRAVAYGAKGYPERAYAKWLVLNFLWDTSGQEIVRRRTLFRHALEAPNKQYKIVRPLDQMVNSVYSASLKFYRKERGKGRSAIDVSTFPSASEPLTQSPEELSSI